MELRANVMIDALADATSAVLDERFGHTMNDSPPNISFSSTSVRSAGRRADATRKLLVGRHGTHHSLAGSPNSSNGSGRTKPRSRAI